MPKHPKEICDLIPKRMTVSHKGTYGRLLIIAGSNQYVGAAELVVESALRSGVGMVYLIAISSVAHAVRVRSPEAIVIEVPDKGGCIDPEMVSIIEDTLNQYEIGAICIGPGIGSIHNGNEFYEAILNQVLEKKCPILVDADALVNMYGLLVTHTLSSNQCILTPHPKEFLNMQGQLSLMMDISDELRMACQKIDQVIVYKTHETIVASKDKLWKNPTGNSALATAGTGDVLSGLIAGLMAQGMTCIDAARLGVYVHGLSADIGAKKLGARSFLARDCCNHIANAFQELVQNEE